VLAHELRIKLKSAANSMQNEFAHRSDLNGALEPCRCIRCKARTGWMEEVRLNSVTARIKLRINRKDKKGLALIYHLKTSLTDSKQAWSQMLFALQLVAWVVMVLTLAEPAPIIPFESS
jgi:hypothetical protein